MTSYESILEARGWTETRLIKEHAAGISEIKRMMLRETCFSCMSTRHGSMECHTNRVVFREYGVRTAFGGRKTVHGWNKTVYYRESPNMSRPKAILRTKLSYEDAVAERPSLAEGNLPRHISGATEQAAPPADARPASQEDPQKMEEDYEEAERLFEHSI